MLFSKTTKDREATKLTERDCERNDRVTTTLGELLMYFLAVALIVGLGLLLNSGIEQTVAYFKQVLGP